MSTTTIREHPILFNAEMVRAILDGRKTQTRRVAKLTSGAHVKEPRGHRRWHPGDPEAVNACPFGAPGDRLWVRETWSASTHSHPIHKPSQGHTIWYLADNNRPMWADCRWKPSIHMPRWASRILLEVKAVRVERVQDISDEDVVAEGVTIPCDDHGRVLLDVSSKYAPALYAKEHGMLRAHMASLWDSINAERGYGWDTNPWVWAIEFERVEVSS